MPTIWPRLLERLASGDPLISADDLRAIKPELDRAIAMGVLREAEAARWIMCDSCPERHWSEVVWVAGGQRAFIACPQEGTVDVESARLRQWRIDPGSVARHTANALGLTSSVEVLLPQHLWSLGRRRLGGRYRDTFLGIGGGPTVAEMSAAVRSSIGHGSALLLTVCCDGATQAPQAGHEYVDLASVSRLDVDQLVLDLEYLEDRFAERAPTSRRPVRSIPATAATTWGDVSILVFDGFMRINLPGKEHEVEFAGLGLDEQAQPIELLMLFAAARGTLDAGRLGTVVSGDSPIKMRMLRLRQLLQSLIDIDGDPLSYSKKARTYSCNFRIQLDRDEGFRTPASASWLDFAFHERADGRIVVSVPEKVRVRAHGSNSRGGPTVTEMAERDSTSRRAHSLEDMKLRLDAGRLTEEGTAFVELLRSGGTLARRGNDIVVLRLAQRLREWTGLDGEPLRLVEASRCWTAVFACSSDIKATRK